ncbi:chemotaxis protein CheW [Yunchengibacter salinarum]|uniref:chemotaxis protein CheW n=1 Tax=Yunchengibacter salinarum TaxID=3133399 RepID=UPI0035B65B4C
MDDLLNEFLTETAESIDVVDVELVKLEQDPKNKEVLDNIFRLVHTIKGTCGFLGLPRLESVAHSSENVLGKFRDGDLEVTEGSVTVVLESLDRIKEILNGLEQTEEEPEGDDSELIAKLDAIYEGGSVDGAAGGDKASDGGSEDEDTVDGEIVDPALGRPLKTGEVSLDELEAAFNNAPGPEELAAEEAAEDSGAGGGDKADQTLFERIGGEDQIAVAAQLAASRVDGVGTLAPFFKETPLDKRKGQFQGLMLSLFKNDEKASESVARQLVTQSGFDDSAFDALLDVVKSALKECDLSEDLIDEAVMSFELVRDAVLSSSRAVAKAEQPKGKETAADQGGGQGGGKRTTQSIRVSVDLLEDLMTMVSELVLTRNQLMQIVRNSEENGETNELSVPLQRLSQCTSELQENVMKTRMQPIGNAWAKLPRIVRDLSVELDKKIELEMIGSETELDRQVLELIKDPLTHMVRNSADHGIETPAERMAAGKPELGTITLNAFHEGGHIILEIRDDGGGVSAEKLYSAALKKGLATESELQEMSDAQIQNFIFHPGFSTAAEVTSVSGRGVGMDVVKSNIEKIGGTIDMTSVVGKGTTFQIKIPLTLAIVAGLIVEASGERYAIPQISVLELVRTSEESEHRIETIKDSPVLRLRNRLLPLVYLNEVLGFNSHEEMMSREKKDDFIVVAQVGAFTFGIVVDQVFDTEEIVVKPVAPVLKHLDIYSGNTILGDGSVIMILDPNGIAKLASSAATDSRDDEIQEKADAQRRLNEDELESMLLFRAGDDTPKVVPLALVSRLEDIEVERIERSNGRLVVQYRGNLMPIIKATNDMSMKSEGRQPVLVFSDREFTMGLAVDEIVDIVEEKMDVKLASSNEGVMGSAVISEKTCEVIDVAYYFNKAFEKWMRRGGEQDGDAEAEGHYVLVVDDSDFFRHMLKPLLRAEGYGVTCVASAAEALALRDEGETFDVIISDIDMPDMNGFEFAETLKRDGAWKSIPLVALSGMAADRDVARGREAGFDDYVAKFDKQTVLKSLAQQLKLRGDAA